MRYLFLEEGGIRARMPGLTGLPKTERSEGPEHAGKAGDEETNRDAALQDPRGMAKARLLEAQSWLAQM